jgi:hypothetical protein
MLEEDRVEAATGIRDGKDARIGLQYKDGAAEEGRNSLI